MPETTGELRDAIRRSGVTGAPVCLHTSLRSFGPRPPRAGAVIDAFLREGCTLMVPAFSGSAFAVPPPQDIRPARNGVDYDAPPCAEPHDRVYSPDSNEINETLGALPAALLRRAGRRRGTDPLSSFAAVGPLADRLIAAQRAGDVYGPLATLATAGGFVVLIGVGLERMTLVHLAEKRAGRNLLRRWANGPDGKPLTVESGGCSEGFGNLEPALRPIRRVVHAGESTWQVFPARSALNIATHAIRRNPRITHCGTPCARCDDAVAGGPLI